jgi:hypothetical protein
LTTLRIRDGWAAVARVAASALACCAVVVAVLALRTDHRCAAVQDDAGRAARSELTRLAHKASERCGDPRNEAWVVGVATVRGDRAAAIDLARRMTRSSPDDYIGWLGLYRLTGDRRALARAHELNPRGVPLS